MIRIAQYNMFPDSSQVVLRSQGAYYNHQIYKENQQCNLLYPVGVGVETLRSVVQIDFFRRRVRLAFLLFRTGFKGVGSLFTEPTA